MEDKETETKTETDDEGKPTKKIYRTIEEQIEYLKENKNIDPDTIDKSMFDEKTYLSIVTPYTDLVCIGRDGSEDKNHIYNENTNFEEFLNWSKIDKYISLKLHDAIGKFEKKLKLFLETTICKMMSDSGDTSCCDYSGWKKYITGSSYLKLVKINENAGYRGPSITNLSQIYSRKDSIEKMLSIINGQRNSTSLIKHYKEKGYIPFWVLIHTLTINQLIQLFSLLDYDTKKEFVKQVTQIQPKRINDTEIKQFESKLSCIADIRNRVNHYEPIIQLIISEKADKYGIVKSSIDLLWNYYISTEEKMLVVLERPEILTAQNDYNKKNYIHIVEILDILDKN